MTLDCPYEERYRGAIAIRHQGCTYFIVLVVDGKHRGCLCYIDLDDQGPPAFIPDGFLTFYENWLDRTLSGRR